MLGRKQNAFSEKKIQMLPWLIQQSQGLFKKLRNVCCISHLRSCANLTEM